MITKFRKHNSSMDLSQKRQVIDGIAVPADFTFSHISTLTTTTSTTGTTTG